MTPTAETERRLRVRDGILEQLGDITYDILRRYGIAPGNPVPVAENANAVAASA